MYQSSGMHFREERDPRAGRRCGCRPHFASRHGFGGEQDPMDSRGFGSRGRFGRGRERLFDGGVMRLVILQQLAEEPSYGYQLIKRLESRMAGGYRPSAGVVYPTLTMLEEQGLTAATTNTDGKKVYAVTNEGQAYLKQNGERLDEIASLMNAAGRGFERGRSPEVMQAVHRLREAISAKLHREGTTPEQVARVVEAIRGAADAVEKI